MTATVRLDKKLESRLNNIANILHKKMNIVSCEFESASQLMEDFWKSVDYYMENNT